MINLLCLLHLFRLFQWFFGTGILELPHVVEWKHRCWMGEKWCPPSPGEQAQGGQGVGTHTLGRGGKWGGVSAAGTSFADPWWWAGTQAGPCTAHSWVSTSCTSALVFTFRKQWCPFQPGASWALKRVVCRMRTALSSQLGGEGACWARGTGAGLCWWLTPCPWHCSCCVLPGAVALAKGSLVHGGDGLVGQALPPVWWPRAWQGVGVGYVAGEGGDGAMVLAWRSLEWRKGMLWFGDQLSCSPSRETPNQMVYIQTLHSS